MTTPQDFDDDYLFSGAGAPDPQVARLEALLGRYRHRAAAPRRRRVPVAALATCAALLALLLSWWLLWPAPLPEVAVLRADGSRLALSTWLEPSAVERLQMPQVGWVELAAGARLQARRLDRDRASFELARGRIEVFVMPTVAARFFEVETPVTTCIDLGCRYVLEVDPRTEEALVRVTLGLVAFADHGREVLVPRGAQCRAVSERGAGTPRFADAAPALRDAVDAFDRASGPEARAAAARAVAAAASSADDTLPLWHLLQSAPESARAAVEAALVRLVGAPKAERDLAAWRAHVDPYWWGK